MRRFYNFSASKDIDVRKRIELIQDFQMPAISDVIKVSRDGQYVLATGKDILVCLPQVYILILVVYLLPQV